MAIYEPGDFPPGSPCIKDSCMVCNLHQTKCLRIAIDEAMGAFIQGLSSHGQCWMAEVTIQDYPWPSAFVASPNQYPVQCNGGVWPGGEYERRMQHIRCECNRERVGSDNPLIGLCEMQSPGGITSVQRYENTGQDQGPRGIYDPVQQKGISEILLQCIISQAGHPSIQYHWSMQGNPYCVLLVTTPAPMVQQGAGVTRINKYFIPDRDRQLTIVPQAYTGYDDPMGNPLWKFLKKICV